MFIEYDSGADHANTPPDGLYFIAITVVNDCNFETEVGSLESRLGKAIVID